jgi:predicted DNA-binding transcriptional regulator AlpA
MAVFTDDALLPSAAVRRDLGDVSEATLRRWVGRGFPQPVRIGRRAFWRRSDVQRWVAQRRAQ